MVLRDSPEPAGRESAAGTHNPQPPTAVADDASRPGGGMCPHRGHDLEDCVLQLDTQTRSWRCWQHPAPPIPRQRGDLGRVTLTRRWAG